MVVWSYPPMQSFPIKTYIQQKRRIAPTTCTISLPSFRRITARHPSPTPQTPHAATQSSHQWLDPGATCHPRSVLNRNPTTFLSSPQHDTSTRAQRRGRLSVYSNCRQVLLPSSLSGSFNSNVVSASWLNLNSTRVHFLPSLTRN